MQALNKSYGSLTYRCTYLGKPPSFVFSVVLFDPYSSGPLIIDKVKCVFPKLVARGIMLLEICFKLMLIFFLEAANF